MTWFSYDRRQRDKIRTAIHPVLKPGIELDRVIERLTSTARDCIRMRTTDENILLEGEAIRDDLCRLADLIDRQIEAWEDLFEKRDNRMMLSSIMAADRALDEYGLTLEQLPDIFRKTAQAQRVFPSNRQPNNAARVFTRECLTIWRQCTDHEPPKKAPKNDPFHRFVVAAMPDVVRSTTIHLTGMTGLVREVLKDGSEPEEHSNQ